MRNCEIGDRSGKSFSFTISHFRSFALLSIRSSFINWHVISTRRFEPAWQVLREGIAARAFPGASAAVIHSSSREPVFHALGSFTYNGESVAVVPQTVFDLASLTKVVATTSMAMLLYDHGSLDLEMPVAEVLPEFLSRFRNRRRQRVSIRHLLEHSSGLPEAAHLPRSAVDKESTLQAACRVPLDEAPGIRTLYSDLGFIILGGALERIAGQSLDAYCSAHIFALAGMTETCFNPPLRMRSFIPPTRFVGTTGKLVQGVVNSRDCSMMGGVAGHVGLFSNVIDLARFASIMLRENAAVFQRDTVALFTRHAQHPARSSRALGWDTPSYPAQCGRYFGPHSFGHLGSTGTSIWIDPDQGLAVVLLSNRTWPDGKNQLIKQFRPRFHDAVVQCLR